MARYSPQSWPVKDMFDRISPRYDAANTILSFGMHYIWKRRAVSVIPPEYSGGKAMDLCTGTGDLIAFLKLKFGEVYGVDFSPKMLSLCRERYKSIEGLNLVEADAMDLPFPDGFFDCITVAFGVRNFPDLGRGLSEMKRVLKEGGFLSVLEFGQPRGIISPLYRFYCRRIMPLVGRIVTGYREPYEYLPVTAESFPCGEKFCKILQEKGFKMIEFRSLFRGIAYIYTCIC
ncbi:MAG: bifunctional demethylmenaquinone methyltransferase/2-methoxy-6-polyprenyl-1,4-benzoquinol methylase UbiE [Candidatus Dadabacteria bacterium]|nr:MAG: bifunctional demethylmenaquinone methyltransferase/2-methoxy-6-polyprenyl-1,4-benzoquinol methylase UbiE [Candidatus Dadabacteria bacterium]